MLRRKVAIWTIATLVCLAGAWGAITVFAAGPPKDAKYVGSKKCRSCHLKEHKTWRKTKHYKTFEQLEGPEKKDPDCLKCHTTGYGKPGGFVSEKDTPDLRSTGCESCHGPGGKHVVAAKSAPETGKWDKKMSKTPAANTCVKCHNPHVSQKARIKKLREERKGKDG